MHLQLRSCQLRPWVTWCECQRLVQQIVGILVFAKRNLRQRLAGENTRLGFGGQALGRKRENISVVAGSGEGYRIGGQGFLRIPVQPHGALQFFLGRFCVAAVEVDRAQQPASFSEILVFLQGAFQLQYGSALVARSKILFGAGEMILRAVPGAAHEEECQSQRQK